MCEVIDAFLLFVFSSSCFSLFWLDSHPLKILVFPTFKRITAYLESRLCVNPLLSRAQGPPTPTTVRPPPPLMTFNVMCQAFWSGTEGSSSLADQLRVPPLPSPPFPSPPFLLPPIPIPSSAQPSSALMRQLSLFLRHSSGAISLTRPAHFFFLSVSLSLFFLLPSPTPSAPFSLLHSVFVQHFFISVWNIFLYEYISPPLSLTRSSFCLNSRFLFPSPAPSSPSLSFLVRSLLSVNQLS